MFPTRPIPFVPGWDVYNDDGLLVATRKTKLSEYQRAFGALMEVAARDLGELWMLTDAQTRLAERLATAEGLHPKITPLVRRGPT
jgi:hypothetical protein